jgi:predicted porin
MALPLTSTLAEGPIDGSVYGKVNLTLQQTDGGSDSVSELNSNASRIGFKGKTALNDMFNVIYKAEYETAADGDGLEGFKNRNIYVGLQGGFGTVFAGKNDTPLKLAQEDVDLFNDLSGDIKNVLEGETRASNIIFYQTPDFGGFQFNFAPTLGEVAGDDDRNSVGDSFSTSLTFNSDMLFFGLAHDSNVKSGSFEKDYLDITRFVAQVVLGNVTLGGLIQSAEDGDSYSSGSYYDSDGWHLSAAVKFGDVKLKLQHTESESDDSWYGYDAVMTSAGVDYKLGDNTKLFGFYTTYEKERDGASYQEEDTAGIGVEHKF